MVILTLCSRTGYLVSKLISSSQLAIWTPAPPPLPSSWWHMSRGSLSLFWAEDVKKQTGVPSTSLFPVATASRSRRWQSPKKESTSTGRTAAYQSSNDIRLAVLFKSSIFLLIFCPSVLSIIKRGYISILVNLSAPSYSSLSFCFMYFEALFYPACQRVRCW